MLRLEELLRVAEIEFRDIVKDTTLMGTKGRIILVDGSFMDVFLSQKLKDKFGFHWERREIDGSLYRYDNFPDMNWQNIATYPHHFHDGADEKVESAFFPKKPMEGFRDFMNFVRKKITGEKHEGIQEGQELVY